MFYVRDVKAALAIMTKFDPNDILSSGKWANGFKEEKEKLLVAMYEQFSQVSSRRKVTLEQFKKFISRIRTERKSK